MDKLLNQKLTKKMVENINPELEKKIEEELKILGNKGERVAEWR